MQVPMGITIALENLSVEINLAFAQRNQPISENLKMNLLSPATKGFLFLQQAIEKNDENKFRDCMNIFKEISFDAFPFLQAIAYYRFRCRNLEATNESDMKRFIMDVINSEVILIYADYAQHNLEVSMFYNELLQICVSHDVESKFTDIKNDLKIYVAADVSN